MTSMKLLLNELGLQVAELRRHWLEPVFGTLLVSGLFFGFYHVVRGFGDQPPRLDGIVIGYIGWGVAGAAYNATARHLADEAKTGVLQQLYLGAQPIHRVLLCRAALHMVSGLVSAAVMAAIAMLLTGRWIALPWLPAIGLLMLAAISLAGLGLGLGGAVLVQRRLHTLAAVMNVLLLACVAAPAYPLNAFALLPFSLGASLVRALAAGAPLPSLSLYGLVALNSSAYLFAGVLLFRGLERRARRSNAFVG